MIIQSISELKEIISSNIQSGKKVLVKKGVFDVIHPGHIYAIEQFKKSADIVIVLIQSDSFTKKKKGPTRPINPQLQRAQVVDGLKGVDYVYLDNSESREEYIEVLIQIKPSIVAITEGDMEKSSVYRSKYWELKEFPDKKLPGFSTTEIINRVVKNYTL